MIFMIIRSGSLSHIGKKRSKNEDSIGCQDELGLYVLCDGVGGSHRSGEVASQTAAEAWLGAMEPWLAQNKTRLSSLPSHQIAATLNRIVQDINQKVFTLGGMATTFEGVWIHGSYAWLCHVGDSRVYLWRQGKLYLVTEDQTFENEWIRTGEYTPEVARKSPYAKALTQAIGAQPVVKTDIRRMELMPGDGLLLCSDGLTKMMTDEGISSVIKSEGLDLQRVANRLVELANAQGGVDNISVILIDAQPANQVAAPSQARPSAQFKVEAIAKVSFFEGLEYPELLKLLEIAELETFEPGECLTEEGTPGDEMFVILSGEVEVYREGEFLLVHGAGSSIGEMGVLDRQERSATVRARDTVVTLVFPREKFLSLLKANPNLALKVTWKIIMHLIGLTRRMTGNMVNQIKNKN